MSGRVRYPIGPAVPLAPITPTLRIRTRLRVSAGDRAVLGAVGAHLGRLANADLAWRCQSGLAHNADVWALRKRRTTAECSSRWAGAITKASHAACQTARRNQLRQQADLTRAIATIQEKIKLPCHSATERRALLKGRCRQPTFGYRSEPELAMKQARLAHLRASLAGLDRDVSAGRVHITRGADARCAIACTWTRPG